MGSWLPAGYSVLPAITDQESQKRKGYDLWT
jgi:hypothetical protein